MLLRFACLATTLAACADANDIIIRLSPEVVSSLDGTVGVHVIVFADRSPAANESVDLAIDYTDRNGISHSIAPVTGTSDEAGAFDTQLTGLTFDGTATVTATLTGSSITAGATVAVLDRSPPKVAIMPPANNQISVNQDVRITVTATDEIGVSQVFFESDTNGRNQRDRATITTGAATASIAFDVTANDAQVGQTMTLHALAADLSGNLAAAQPVTLSVVP